MDHLHRIGFTVAIFFIVAMVNCQRQNYNNKANAAVKSKDCSKCNPESCPEPKAVCPTGLVKDVCDCCMVCGRLEGEACDVDIVNDDRQQFNKPFYVPVQGRCGTNLNCYLHKDEESNSVTDYASCVCKGQNAVCGEDGKTYKNKCIFDQTMAGRAERFRIVRDEPCDESPRILSSSQSLEEKVGKDVILSCEVAGYPTPKIEWTFAPMDRQKIVTLPSDQTSKSVQVRGGPDHYQTTSWLQIQKLQTEDAGIYSCVARNKLGKAIAETKLLIISDGSDL